MNSQLEYKRRIIAPAAIFVFLGMRRLLADVAVGDYLALGIALLLNGIMEFHRGNRRTGFGLGLAGLLAGIGSEWTYNGEQFGDSAVRLLLIEWTTLYQNLAMFTVAIFVVGYCIRIARGAPQPAWFEFLDVGLNRWNRLAILTMAAYMIYWLTPTGILQGRFWAEEGSIYFKNAWELPPQQSLFFVSPVQGYYALISNLASMAAAHFMPLGQAPLLTTAIALAIHLFPVWVILYSDIDALPTLWSRALAALAIPLVQPTSEIWGTTISSQFWLLAATAFILATTTTNKYIHRGRLTILALSGVTGAVCCIFWPFFAAIAVREKSRTRWTECLAYGAGCALQVLAIIGQPSRPTNLDLISFPGLALTKGFILPLFGSLVANHAGRLLGDFNLVGNALGALAGMAPFIIGGIVLLAFGRRPALILFCLSVFASVFCFVKSLAPASHDEWASLLTRSDGGRYFYAPNVLLILACWMLPREKPRFNLPIRWAPVVRNLSLGLATLAFATGFSTVPNVQAGVSWKVEVERWEANPKYVLRIWPDGWKLPIHKAP